MFHKERESIQVIFRNKEIMECSYELCEMLKKENHSVFLIVENNKTKSNKLIEFVETNYSSSEVGKIKEMIELLKSKDFSKFQIVFLCGYISELYDKDNEKVALYSRVKENGWDAYELIQLIPPKTKIEDNVNAWYVLNFCTCLNKKFYFDKPIAEITLKMFLSLIEYLEKRKSQAVVVLRLMEIFLYCYNDFDIKSINEIFKKDLYKILSKFEDISKNFPQHTQSIISRSVRVIKDEYLDTLMFLRLLNKKYSSKIEKLVKNFEKLSDENKESFGKWMKFLIHIAPFRTRIKINDELKGNFKGFVDENGFLTDLVFEKSNDKLKREFKTLLTEMIDKVNPSNNTKSREKHRTNIINYLNKSRKIEKKFDGFIAGEALEYIIKAFEDSSLYEEKEEEKNKEWNYKRLMELIRYCYHVLGDTKNLDVYKLEKYTRNIKDVLKGKNEILLSVGTPSKENEVGHQFYVIIKNIESKEAIIVIVNGGYELDMSLIDKKTSTKRGAKFLNIQEIHVKNDVEKVIYTIISHSKNTVNTNNLSKKLENFGDCITKDYTYYTYPKQQQGNCTVHNLIYAIKYILKDEPDLYSKFITKVLDGIFNNLERIKN